ncbi:TPA: radical SAM protein, partial [Clostridioides difficile]|nr:radical SAM protein [Clostridioides difficile]
GNKKTNVKYMEEKFGVLLKTQESDLDINQLEIVLDGKSLISANMRDIHRKLYDIYDL